MGSEVSKEDSSSHGGSSHDQSYATDVAAFEAEQIKMREISRMDQTIRSRLHQGVKYNMKVLLCGERGTGKTMLWQRLQGQPFAAKLESTPEIQSATINWTSPLASRTAAGKDDVVKVEVWDVVDHAIVVDKSTSDSIAADMVYNLTGEVEDGRHAIVPVDASVVDIYKDSHAVIFLISPSSASSLAYVREKYPQVPGHVSILLVLNFKDQTRAALGVAAPTSEVSLQAVQELCAEIRSFRSNCANDDVTALETSLLDCYGLLHLHHYLDVPFLRLKQRSLQEQLAAVESDLHLCHAEIAHKVETTKYDDYLRQYNARKREHLRHESAEPASPPAAPVPPLQLPARSPVRAQAVPTAAAAANSSTSAPRAAPESVAAPRVEQVQVSPPKPASQPLPAADRAPAPASVPVHVSVSVTDTAEDTPRPHDSLDATAHGANGTGANNSNNSSNADSVKSNASSSFDGSTAVVFEPSPQVLTSLSPGSSDIFTPALPPSPPPPAASTMVVVEEQERVQEPVEEVESEDGRARYSPVEDTVHVSSFAFMSEPQTEQHQEYHQHGGEPEGEEREENHSSVDVPAAANDAEEPPVEVLAPPVESTAQLDSFLAQDDEDDVGGDVAGEREEEKRVEVEEYGTLPTAPSSAPSTAPSSAKTPSAASMSTSVSVGATRGSVVRKSQSLSEKNGSGSGSDSGDASPARAAPVSRQNHGNNRSSHTTMSKMVGESDSSDDEDGGDRGNAKLNQKVTFGVKALRSVKNNSKSATSAASAPLAAPSGGLRKAKPSANRNGISSAVNTVVVSPTDLEEVDL